MNQSLKKLLPKIILFAVLSIVIVIVIISINDFNQIIEVLKNVSWLWFLAAFGILLLYMFLNPLTLCILGRRGEEGKIRFRHSMMIGTIEYFFNGITPFSSGGQPFQVYAYNKIGVRPHRSSGILLMNFVITQTSIVLMCLGSLFFYQQLTQGTTHLEVMIIIGLVINFFILFIFTSLGISKTIRRILQKFVNKVFNLKIFKGKLVKYISVFEHYCNEAQATFKSLVVKKRLFLLCLTTKLTGLICYYTIPFFILRALGIEVTASNIPLITAMTTFAVAMTCFIPTPGSAGGIEFAFQSLFVTVIPTATASVAVSGMLLWRLLTYYLLMFISFIVYLIFEKVSSKKVAVLEEVIPEESSDEEEIRTKELINEETTEE